MNVQALREEFGTAQREAQTLISAAAEAKRDLTAEEKTANERRYGRMEQIKIQFDDMAKFAKLALDAGNVTLPAVPAGKTEFDASQGRQSFKDAAGNLNLDAIRAGINHYARTGDIRQVYTVTTGTDSSAFLPKQVLQPVTVRRLQNSFRAVLAAYGQKPMEIDTVATFSIPVADDTANTGQTTSESASSETDLDPNNSAGIVIAPTLYDSKAFFYSNTMVGASSFDVVEYTLPMAQLRIQKSQESAWTTELIGGASVGKTLESATAITYNDILDWEHSLAPAYRTDAAFIVSDSLYRALRGVVDGVARPIFDQDPTNVFAGKIHGRPVIVSDYLQTLAANHVCGAFLSADAIKIVDVMNARLARYANLPGHPDQIGFEMFQNGDFGFVANGVSLLKSAIS